MAIVALKFFRRIRRIRRRVRRARVMPLRDAFRLALNENSPVDIQIFLPFIGREITLRGATTDVLCFEKVFVDQEYSSPFEIAPRVSAHNGRPPWVVR